MFTLDVIAERLGYRPDGVMQICCLNTIPDLQKLKVVRSGISKTINKYSSGISETVVFPTLNENEQQIVLDEYSVLVTRNGDWVCYLFMLKNKGEN